MASAAQLKRKAENEAFLRNANVRAALEMISRSEGTNGDYYKMVYGTVVYSPLFPQLVGRKNVSLPNLNQFPKILVQVNNKGLKSSAAGKYQILNDTYAWTAAKLGITDFSPRSQDLIAVELIRFRGAMDYLLAGDIVGALKNSNPKLEWASIVGNDYGQGTHSIEALTAWYRSALAPVETLAKNPVSSSVAIAVGLLFFS